MSKVSNKENLKKIQFAWLKNDRASCKNVQCLKEVYSKRIEFLKQYDDKKIFNNPFEGEYRVNYSVLTIENNYDFMIVKVDPHNLRTCTTDGKFRNINNILYSDDTNDIGVDEKVCKMSLIKINNNTVFLSVESDGCFKWCGYNTYFDEGEYYKVK